MNDNSKEKFAHFRLADGELITLRRLSDELGLSLSELLRLLVSKGLDRLLGEVDSSDSTATR